MCAVSPAPTTADRKLIQEGIEEITWVAALKPASIGVPEYHDEQRTYLELAVLLVDLREAGKVTRLAELIHRAIPYREIDGEVVINLSTKALQQEKQQLIERL
jgi:hypothetical protein